VNAGSDSEFVETGALARFVLRRDRWRIVLWIAAIGLLVIVTAGSVKGLYPTQHDLDVAAAASEDNPAAIAFNGPPFALDTIGGQVAFQVSSFGLLTMGLMSALMMSRLTRTEEDSGRLELVRSMPVGRHAPLAAATLVVLGMNVVVGVLVASSLSASGLPVHGSIVLGASFAVVGSVFVAITALVAQVVENPRVVSGVVGGLLGVAFLLRAIGDIGDGTVSWLSPIGWGQKARPYAGERWWPLCFAIGMAVAIGAAGFALATRRDFGSGLVQPRPGRTAAEPSLGRPLGLAVRLQRGTVLWWGVAILALGITYGSLASSIDDFVKDNQTLADLLARATGASLTDSYLATSLLLTALIGTGCAIQIIVRMRSEENEGRAEPVLATPMSRWRWVGTHVGVAAAGVLLVIIADGIGMGATYALVIGDAGQAVRLLVAALAYVPAVAVVVGFAVALFGVLPRWIALAWVALAACFVVAMFEPLLNLPSWVTAVSPFEHTPLVPAHTADPLPLAVLSVVAATLFATGFVGARRRDIG
jgi:ABC-2 type transport system permease protein